MFLLLRQLTVFVRGGSGGVGGGLPGAPLVVSICHVQSMVFTHCLARADLTNAPHVFWVEFLVYQSDIFNRITWKHFKAPRRCWREPRGASDPLVRTTATDDLK